ncbi:hypothetical protein [Actinomadura sp. 6N118]|uniref:hypothetical protein n=1 Tax=Actinomadura sp. 6N118 TaxID=3375151 RepID=UPI0037B3C5A5
MGDDNTRHDSLVAATELDEQGRWLEAVELLRAELTEHGPHPRVLVKLADLEAEKGMECQALEHSAQALALAPDDPDQVVGHVERALTLSYLRQALHVVETRPDDAHPKIRQVRAAVYRRAGLRALALDAYGDVAGLDPAARRARRTSWLLTGGPLSLCRDRVRDHDRNCLRLWRSWSVHHAEIASLPGMGDDAATQIQRSLDTYLLGWARSFSTVTAVWQSWRNAARRLLLVLVATVVAVALATGFSVPAALAGTGVAVVSAAAIPLAVFRGQPRIPFWTGVRRSVPLVVLWCGAGIGLLRAGDLGQRPIAWAAGAGLLTAVVLAAVPQALNLVATYDLLRREARHPQAAAIDRLLELRADVRCGEGHCPVEQRRALFRHLERTARLIEGPLMGQVSGRDPATRAWVHRHCAAAATAVRELKRDVAAPTASRWEHLEAQLTRTLAALATGNLGELPTVEPGAADLPRPSRFTTAVRLLRAALIAVAPIVMVVAAQPLLDLKPDHYALAKAGAALWALLYLLISLDPTLREKLAAIGDLFAAARGDRPWNGEAAEPPSSARGPGTTRF